MFRFILTDIKGRAIYATPDARIVSGPYMDFVDDQFLEYRTYTERGEKVIKSVKLGILEFEARVRRDIRAVRV